MKTRNLLLLVLLAGALIGWAAWTMRPQPKPGIALIGTKVLPGLPVNQVSKIVLTTTNNTITLAKVKGTWSVANRFNYPAAFDKIADGLLLLGELSVGQVLTVSEAQKASLHLLDPAAPDPARKAQAGTRVELRDETDGLLATLLIGKNFMRTAPEGDVQGMFGYGDYPDGQYVLSADGRVFLVSQNIDRLTDDVKNWLAGEFVNVAANDIREIAITASDRAPIKLVRPEDGAPFALEGLKEAEGTLDAAKVNQISGALNLLGFDDIAAPTLPTKETGLEHPLVFEARTREGQVFTLRIGNTTTGDTFDRYAQLAVAWKAPAEPRASEKPEDGRRKTEDRPQEAKTNAVDTAEANRQKADESAKADKTKALNDRLAPWTFILKSYRVEPLLIKRAELIKKTEPPGVQKTDAGLPAVAPGAKEGHRTPDDGGQTTNSRPEGGK